jgi:hypothetical protein
MMIQNALPFKGDHPPYALAVVPKLLATSSPHHFPTAFPQLPLRSLFLIKMMHLNSTLFSLVSSIVG